MEIADVRFAVKALPAAARPNEMTHTMAVHPLVHQELPYDPEFFLYNHRLTAMQLSNSTPDEAYWRVRRQVILRHTGELPLEVCGPDAERMLDHVFTRDITRVRAGRCSYQFPCYDDGGMITDGVLMRLARDRFWYGQADGDLFSWLKANARSFDVEVRDPGVWISQVQGPRSLDVLAAAVDGDYPEPFRYFDIAEVLIAGQKVKLSRSGFTNELGWEFYLEPETDIRAIGERILEAGKPFGLLPTSADGFRARRIEAGLLNAGSDFDASVTPFVAGLGTVRRSRQARVHRQAGTGIRRQAPSHLGPASPGRNRTAGRDVAPERCTGRPRVLERVVALPAVRRRYRASPRPGSRTRHNTGGTVRRRRDPVCHRLRHADVRREAGDSPRTACRHSGNPRYGGGVTRDHLRRHEECRRVRRHSRRVLRVRLLQDVRRSLRRLDAGSLRVRKPRSANVCGAPSRFGDRAPLLLRTVETLAAWAVSPRPVRFRPPCARRNRSRVADR